MAERNIDDHAVQLERNGYVVVEDFFSLDDVLAAYYEVERLYARDVELRKELKSDSAFFVGPECSRIMTSPTHLLLNIYGLSPALNRLFEKILVDRFSAGLLQRLGGAGWKIRGYNSQRLTGEIDNAPSVGVASNPHEWHRDSPGEICISIFLTDLPHRNMGATSLVRGSHELPYCPRWNCLLGPPHRIKQGMRIVGDFFLRHNVFSRYIGDMVNKNSTGAYGKRGDFYIFINDVWHGREPNTSGLPGIKIMVGAFPADVPFPDEVPIPSDNILNRLSSQFRAAAAQTALPGNSQDNILKRVQLKQKRSPKLIFALAQSERRAADYLARIFMKA